jgi:hypothetical protein
MCKRFCRGKKTDLVREVRLWQKQSKAGRQPLGALAKRLGVRCRVLQRILPRVGAASRFAVAKNAVVKTARVAWRFDAKNPSKKTLKSTALTSKLTAVKAGKAISARSVRRFVAPAREAHQKAKDAYWKKWHQKHRNCGITESQMDELGRMSQGW